MMDFDFNNEIIDYKLSSNIDIELLEKEIFLPIKANNLNTIVVAFDSSDSFKTKLENIFSTSIQIIKIENKEKILFELQHIKIKIELFNLIHQHNNQSHIETFFNCLFVFCLDKNISDIHIESRVDKFSIRIRHDGVLIKLVNFDLEYFGILSAYIKLISKLDISQKRLPQNGRFSKIYSDNEYDFRVSSMPTINGESIVVRILNNEKIDIDIDALNIETNSLSLIKQSIKCSSGLILITGPTGSGKTTTLYSILKELNDSTKKIITIEEPVEYKIENIQQININNDIGLDFPTVLKNILRQDPDIIMIGEIRDAQSLNIAIAAALTGHLVLATIHTNNAILTIDRMLDLGADSYLVASTLKLIIAQRLIRRVCSTCNANGCAKCNMTGFAGREIITEVLQNSEELSKAIAKKASSRDLLDIATAEGFINMKQNGQLKINSNLIRLQDLILAID